jgi:6-phospho-beta-glucosidase
VREIVLIGREGNKLPLVANFCQRMLDRSGFPAKIIATTDIAEGVKDASYVLNHIRVGGMQARLLDEKLPPQQGIVGAESLGAGGFANAMRTLPTVLEVGEKIQEVNPGATFINLTNPMGLIVEALVKHTDLRVIGACDLPGVYTKKVAEVLRVDAKDLEVDFIGLNHMGWIQDVKHEGHSCMPKLLEQLEEHRDDGFDNDLIDLFRMIPTRTVSLYFHQDEVLKQQQNTRRFRAEVLYEAEQQILKLYEDPNLNEVPDLTRARNAIWYEDTILPLIEALESKKDQERILCIRNDGAIRDLPDDCSVEVPVKVSGKGLKPRKVGNCPRFLKGLFLAAKESDRLTVEAVRHKSYEYALQALTVNPLVPSMDAARRYLDCLIEAGNLELH